MEFAKYIDNGWRTNMIETIIVRRQDKDKDNWDHITCSAYKASILSIRLLLIFKLDMYYYIKHHPFKIAISVTRIRSHKFFLRLYITHLDNISLRDNTYVHFLIGNVIDYYVTSQIPRLNESTTHMTNDNWKPPLY